MNHSYTKKNSGQIIDDTDLLTVQDGEGTYIGPNILYYYKKMLVCLLTNINTQHGMINGAQTLVSEVIPDLQGNA